VTAHVRPPTGGLRGVVEVPGDKSIAHRALLLGALAEGRTTVTRFSGGADVLSSLEAVRALGARAVRDDDVVCIEGAGHDLGPSRPTTIDCGNSGTTMRLVAGIAAGQPVAVLLDGDGSLRRRPMERVGEPLRRMGARVETTHGHAPLTVHGGTLSGIDWTPSVPSAQVKSAILLAGLRARGETTVHESVATRDHTERLLTHMGAPVRREADALRIQGGTRLRATSVELPGDFSSAMFILVAALVVPGSEVLLRDVGVNPTRVAALVILERMGAAIELRAHGTRAGEPRADLVARGCMLRGVHIGPAEVPGVIDELPALAIAAACADGETLVSGAAELRVKESDRLAALEQLTQLGVALSPRPDGFVIRGRGGGPLTGATIRSGGDHRIAMAFAVAGLAAPDGVTVDDPGCADVSFPGFFARLAALGASVEGQCSA